MIAAEEHVSMCPDCGTLGPIVEQELRRVLPALTRTLAHRNSVRLILELTEDEVRVEVVEMGR